jgi:hypothetical protein
MIITVYSIFFAVQIFFNFASGKNIISSPAPHAFAAVSKVKQVSSNPKSACHRMGFRLNKHFHPKPLPSGIFYLNALPVYFIDKEKVPFYSVAYTSSPFCCSSQLRGPPAWNDIS